MEYNKQDGLDPKQYVDVIRALHITGAIMADTLISLGRMQIIQQQDAAIAAYKAMTTVDDVVINKQFHVVDSDTTFEIIVRR